MIWFAVAVIAFFLIAAIAVIVVDKYDTDDPTTKIFISIPITGMEKTVGKRLHRAIEYMEDYTEYLGGIYEFVYDPDLDRCNDDGEYPGLSKDIPYETQLENDIELMKKCDVVVMTPGWRQSTGCNKEFEIANEMGKMIVIINEFDYES